MACNRLTKELFFTEINLFRIPKRVEKCVDWRVRQINPTFIGTIETNLLEKNEWKK